MLEKSILIPLCVLAYQICPTPRTTHNALSGECLKRAPEGMVPSPFGVSARVAVWPAGRIDEGGEDFLLVCDSRDVAPRARRHAGVRLVHVTPARRMSSPS